MNTLSRVGGAAAAHTPAPELSFGWEATVSVEAPDGSSPYVTVWEDVVELVAHLLGCDPERVAPHVEEADAACGLWLVTLPAALAADLEDNSLVSVELVTTLGLQLAYVEVGEA